MGTDNITVTAVSQTDNTVSDHASCTAVSRVAVQLITSGVFLLLLILAYGAFFGGYFFLRDRTKSIAMLIFATFLLFVTGALSVDMGSPILGLINIPLGVISGAIAVTKVAEEI